MHAIPADVSYEFAADVRAGLTKSGQKELLSKYLYDDVGSALFEVICRLPEYGLTRADERLLHRHAQEIVERLPESIAVAELGSGSGKKNPADSRSLLPPPAYPLLSDRNFPHCAGNVRARAQATSIASASSVSSASI